LIGAFGGITDGIGDAEDPFPPAITLVKASRRATEALPTPETGK